MAVTVTRNETQISVVSPYWEVVHDLRQGGMPTSIRITHGTGENMLRAPIFGAVDDWRQSWSPDVSVEVEENGDDVVLTLSGSLGDAQRQPAPVTFRHVFRYTPYICRQQLTLTPQRPLSVRQITACQLALAPHLTRYAFGSTDWAKAKPRYMHITGPHYDDLTGAVACADTPLQADAVRPWQVTLYRPGYEGLQWCGDSLEYQWNRLLGHENAGRYRLSGHAEETVVELSPLALADEQPAAEFAEPLTFGWYTILPNVPEQGRRKFFEVALGTTNPFPSREQLAAWADCGVNLIRVHNDTDSVEHTDNYWHDGSFPPYRPEKIAEMRRFIDDCHALGMKVVPYFSGMELSPDTPAFAEHGREWFMPSCEHGHIRYTPCSMAGVYGAIMCPDSGWGKYLTEYICRVVETYNFDGYYYDWSSPAPCFNTDHHPGPHNGIDGMIAMLLAHRKWLGDDRLMIMHSGGQQRWLLHDNIGDHIVTFEEGVSRERYYPEEMEDYPPTIPFMRTTSTGIVPIVMSAQPSYLNEARQCEGASHLHRVLAHVVLLDALPYMLARGATLFGYADEQEAMTDPQGMFAAFRRYAQEDWTRYRFYGMGDAPVRTAGQEIGAALYAAPGEGLVVVSNLTATAQPASSVEIAAEFVERYDLPTHVAVPPMAAYQYHLLPVTKTR